MLPSNAKFILPNIYDKKPRFNIKSHLGRNRKILPLRISSNVSYLSEPQNAFQATVQEPLIFTDLYDPGASSNDSLAPSSNHNNTLDKPGSKFRRNDSIVKESRFSIRNNSLVPKDPAPAQSNRRSENISKCRKRAMLQFMRKNGFSEKFGKVAFREPSREKRRSNLRYEPSHAPRPFGEKPPNLRKAAEASPKRNPRWSRRAQQKENQKNKRRVGSRDKTVSVEAYSREVFRQAFREIDSIFYLFANLYEIGSGSYAVAYSAIEKKSGKKFVLKTFKFRDFVKKSYVSRFMVGARG